eukprot:gb/GECH01003810.1/.p1 GENE.gb/GECH01003810.1/~~gb/GECH01003810.1/.p1  ORF type:complete len:505 (+),score=105.54 gb/GECH01003810.1/:1-1515(+)
MKKETELTHHASSQSDFRDEVQRNETRINNISAPHYLRRSSMFRNLTFDKFEAYENDNDNTDDYLNNGNGEDFNNSYVNNRNNINFNFRRRNTVSSSQLISSLNNDNSTFNPMRDNCHNRTENYSFNPSMPNFESDSNVNNPRFSQRYRRRSQRFKRQQKRYSAQHTPLESIPGILDEQDDHPFVPRTFSFLPLPEFKGAKLHYRFTEGIRNNSNRSQNQELMLFCHGLGGSMVLFNPLVKSCVESGYSVVCLDFLGRGKSDYPYGMRPHDAAFFTRQMMLLLDRTGLLRRYRQVTLVGHSMGAAACIHFTHVYGHFVDRLILLAPAGFMWEHRLLSLSKKPIVGKFAELIGRRIVSSLDSEETVRQEFYSWKDLPFEYQEGLKEHAVWHSQNNKHLSHAVMSSIRDFPLREMIPEISHVGKDDTRPILVIWGNKDTVCPFGQGSFIFQSKMNLERILISEKPKNWRRVLTVVPNCSHSVFLECASDVQQMILQFMHHSSRDNH